MHSIHNIAQFLTITDSTTYMEYCIYDLRELPRISPQSSITKNALLLRNSLLRDDDHFILNVSTALTTSELKNVSGICLEQISP